MHCAWGTSCRWHLEQERIVKSAYPRVLSGVYSEERYSLFQMKLRGPHTLRRNWTLLEPQSRFRDEVPKLWEICPHSGKCGAKGFNETSGIKSNGAQEKKRLKRNIIDSCPTAAVRSLYSKLFPVKVHPWHPKKMIRLCTNQTPCERWGLALLRFLCFHVFSFRSACAW